MNPFSRFLSQWSSSSDLNSFVEQWDALEVLTIQVYREKLSVAAATADFAQIWTQARAAYPAWRQALRPFWQQTEAGGQPTVVDPFQLLLDFQQPSDILGNWCAMQHLPAAREALNQLLLTRGEE